MQRKKFLNFRPFVFLAISIALGVISGSLFYFEKLVFGISVCFLFIGVVVLATFFTGGKLKSRVIFLIVFVLIFVIGALSFTSKVKAYNNADLNAHYYTINGRVKEVAETEYGSKVLLDDVVLDGKTSIDYKIALYVYGESKVDVGHKISFYTIIKDKSVMYEDRLSATDIERGVKYIATVNASEIQINGLNQTVFDKVHLFIRNTLKSGAGEREWSTAYGLLIGNTDEMDYDLISSYRESGVAHIFAVSGLHVGFLATVLNFVFNKLKVNKTVKAVVITLALLFYSGVCGFSASSVRATIMSAIMLLSSIRGRRYDGLSAVGLACTVILLYSPLQLFCVGFQLSFVVVLGIILLATPISKLFSFLPEKLSSSIGVVLSAWLVGIPVQLAVFGKFSIFAILANFLLIPIVGVVYVALFVLVIAGGLFGIEAIALFLPGFALKLINLVIGALDYNAFIIADVIMGFFGVAFYLGLLVASGLFNMKKIARIITLICCFVVCVSGTIVGTVIDNNSAKVFVIGSQSECATVISCEEETLMIVSDSGRIPSLNRFKRLSDKEGISRIDKLIFTTGSASDMQVYITRLRTVFDLGCVCYTGEKNENMEKIIFASFNLKAMHFEQGQIISEKTKCVYDLDGYSVRLNVKGNRIAVFSKLGSDYSGYGGLSGEFDLMVAVDYTEQIFSLYSPRTCISYLDSNLFPNAESNGTKKIYLK